MNLVTGTYTLGPDDGSLSIHTGREGAAARMGHDLTLAATVWTAAVRVDAENPSRSRVTATVDAGSLVVREARGGAIGLTDSQRAEIEQTVRAKVLRSDRSPTITFTSTAVIADAGKASASITGDLTIGRRTRPVTLALRVSTAREPRIVADTSIVQTEFGITPYSALLGALRVKDAVGLTVEVRLPAR